MYSLTVPYFNGCLPFHGRKIGTKLHQQPVSLTAHGKPVVRFTFCIMHASRMPLFATPLQLHRKLLCHCVRNHFSRKQCMTGKQAGHIIPMMYPAQAERMGCKQHTEVQHSFLYGTTQPPAFSPFQYIRLRVLAHQISPSVKNQQDCSPALFRQIIRSLQNQMHRPFTGEMHFSVHPPILHGIVCHPRSDKRHCCYFRYIHNFRQFVFSIFIFTTGYTDSLLSFI